MENALEQLTTEEPETIAQTIFEYFTRGETVYLELKKFLGTERKIFDRTALEWEQYFYIEVPKTPTPEQVKIALAQLANRHQTASFHLSYSEFQVEAHEGGHADQYSNNFSKMVKDFQAKNPGKRLPSADTFKALTENSMSDMTSSVVYAKGMVKFWKNTIRGLDSTRKILENITWNLHTEMKLTLPGEHSSVHSQASEHF